MIVESSGISNSSSGAESLASKIVTCTGTAYTKKGRLNAVIRIIKRVVRKVQTAWQKFSEHVTSLKINTKSGEPSTLAPPFSSKCDS
jgi:hypothetical protein